MSVITKTYPDVEGALRTWFRAVTDITTLVDGRTFFAIPQNTQWPLIVVSLIGGGPQRAEPPVLQALVQIDCWGPPRADGKAQKDVAAAVMTKVVSVLESLASGVDLDESTQALGASVQSVIWLPDPDTNQARYVVTAEISAKSKET